MMLGLMSDTASAADENMTSVSLARMTMTQLNQSHLCHRQA